jgi:hypothetical protein
MQRSKVKFEWLSGQLVQNRFRDFEPLNGDKKLRGNRKIAPVHHRKPVA